MRRSRIGLILLVVIAAGCTPAPRERALTVGPPTPPPSTMPTATMQPAPSATPTQAMASFFEAPTTAATPAPEFPDGLVVPGYLAYIRPAPEGSGYEDAVQFLPDTTIQPYGVAGASPEIEQRLLEARTSASPGEMINLYGRFSCPADDVNGCQLLVSYVRLPNEQTNGEPVSGLTGRIVSQGKASQYDDKLVLDGPLPAEVGIASAIFDNGYPMLDAVIAAQRDTSRLVAVDGLLVCGVPDVNGCQLQARALYLDGQVVDPLADWPTYTDDEWGLTLRYPPDANVAREKGPFVTVAWEQAELVIGCRLPGQDDVIDYGRTESLDAVGSALFLGAREPRWAWLVDGRLLGIRYGPIDTVRDGGVVVRGDLTCTLSLWQTGERAFETGDLTGEAQARADVILSTVTYVEPATAPGEGLANPASVFCVDQGGQLEMRTDAQGGQYGVCLFGDGSACDEWAYFRGECSPASQLTPVAASAPTYRHPALGFGLVASPDWTPQERADSVIFTRTLEGRDYALLIGVRPEGASEPVFRSGMPSGEFQSGGALPVFNYVLARNLLIEGGKVKVVAYGSVRTAGKEFSIYLDGSGSTSSAYADVDIPQSIQAEADAIVSSLTIQ